MIGALPPPPLARRDRSRGFVGGFNAADLEWEAWPEGERFGIGLERKLLSFDSRSGALTQLVRGAAAPSAGREWLLDEDVLVLVLAGAVGVGGEMLGHFQFAALPAGWRGAGAPVDGGGFEALWMSSGSEGGATEVIAVGDLMSAPWQSALPGLPGPLPPGLLVKPMWFDPRTGGQTFLSGSLMRRMVDARWEEHPCSEEQVYLGGEFTQREVLRAGAVSLDYAAGGYSFRPPGVWHLGPGSGTDSYCLRVVRTSATLVNRFSAEPGAYPAGFDW